MIQANEPESAGADGAKRVTLVDEELMRTLYALSSALLTHFRLTFSATQLANVLILLFAGHETTAHTLSATMALQAQPGYSRGDIQEEEETYEQIVSVIDKDRDPVRSRAIPFLPCTELFV